MDNKPRILWIDDVFGKTGDGCNSDRDDLCSRLGLKDITGDCFPQSDEGEIIADAIFCRGQVEVSDEVINDPDGTLKVVRNGWNPTLRWSLLLLDMSFKTGAIDEDGEPVGNTEDMNPKKYFGLTILDSLFRDDELREIPVVITSGMNRDVIERRFSTKGVWAFVDKNDLDKNKLKELLKDYGLLADDKIIGHSLPLLKCLREARQKARIPNDNIIILSESGTEKELLVEYIHQHSRSKGDPYSISQDTEESLETALDEANKLLDDGGTLFIDKFDDIIDNAQPDHLQLLANIHDRNLRVITAIKSEEILYEDNFRKAFPDGALIHNIIRIPKLSQRLEDIPELVDYFVKKHEKSKAVFRGEESKVEPRKVSKKALKALRAYSWPGNDRQLENVIRDTVYFNDLNRLEANHLKLPPEKHVHPIPTDVPNSLDQFKIVRRDDVWEQFRESLGGMAMRLQGIAIWELTEKEFRQAIAQILSGRFENTWIDYVFRKNQRLETIFEECSDRQNNYLKIYPGENSDPPDLINFTNPSHLFKIILDEDLWYHFNQYFGGSRPRWNFDFYSKYWEVRENLIVQRVRNLTHHSNTDLIKSYDHDAFKGFCGEILDICQKIGSVPQEKLYQGKVIRFGRRNATVRINEYKSLALEESITVPIDNFQPQEDYRIGKVIFRVDKNRMDCPVYDVFYAEPK